MDPAPPPSPPPSPSPSPPLNAAVTYLAVFQDATNCSGGPTYTIPLDSHAENNCEQCWDRCANGVAGGSYRITGPGSVAIAWNCVGPHDYVSAGFAAAGTAFAIACQLSNTAH